MTPSRLSESWQSRVMDATVQAVAALGLKNGPIHAELRLNDQVRRRYHPSCGQRRIEAEQPFIGREHPVRSRDRGNAPMSESEQVACRRVRTREVGR